MDKIVSRNFFLYSMGRTISFLGNTIQSVAIPLYILRSNGSGTAIGLYAFIYSMPLIFMMPVGGVIGDRFNRKNIMITTDILSGITTLALVFFVINGNINLYVLFIGQAILSSISAVFTSSTFAMITEIVDEKKLLKANSFIGSLDSAAYIIGPVIGAVLLSIAGIKFVFIVNGISFIISAFMEAFISYETGKDKDISKKLNFKTGIDDIYQGVSFLKKTSGIVSLILFAAVTNFFGWASFSVIIPFSFINGIGFSNKYFGLLEASITIGILIGNLLLSVISNKLKRSSIIKLGLYSQSIIFITLGIFFFPEIVNYFGGPVFNLFLIFFILMIFFGIANAIMKTTVFTNMQLMTPNHMKARVLSVYTFFMQSIAPISVIITGLLIDKVKYYNLFMAYAFIILVVTLIFIKSAPMSALSPETVNNNKNDQRLKNKYLQ